MTKRISIGIPVYNEASNINHLLDSINGQVFENEYELTEVLAYDDCSTDQTYSSLLARNDNKLNVIHGDVNKGKSYALSQIFSNTKADILITLDSDITLPDMTVLNALAKSIDMGHNQLVSGWYKYEHNSEFYSKIFSFSGQILKTLGQKHPYYECWGGIMAFDINFYQKINMPERLHRIDGYLYLLCVQMGYRYSFLADIYCVDHKDFAKLDINEYTKIRNRSNSFPDNYFDDFPPSLITKEVALSPFDKVRGIGLPLIKQPFRGIEYLLVRAISTLLSKRFDKQNKVQWRE